MLLLKSVRPFSLVAATLFVAVLFVVASSAAWAQYSDDAFNLKKAQDLYDERGFAEGAAINVDGKLVVSTTNGNVSYSYPISSYQRDGFPFSTTLNYCGSVAHSTYGKYYYASGNGGGYSGWQKFTQNRPLWILGVNGFAVQTVSTTLAYHGCPKDVDTTTWKNASFLEDKHFVWTVDGWDICNRMVNFAEGSFDIPGGGGGQSTATHFRDAIRLLRADGSVLELLNITAAWNHSAPSCIFGHDSDLYTGYYIVNEANNGGYAVVEFTQREDVSDFQYVKTANNPCVYPRTVRYYPGDGLEYVFHENIEPYGTYYRRDSTNLFGGWYSRPTIFYLTQIRSAGARLMDFEYSRQGGKRYIWKDNNLYRRPEVLVDSTTGRALCVGFDDHRITYRDGSMTIEAMGRTTKVRFNTRLGSGHADTGMTNTPTAMPLATFGYIGSVSEEMARKRYKDEELYQSWVGYVNEIEDPEGRTTTFEYEPYVRKYDDQGFPRDNVAVILRNYRLKEVQEPTTRQEITYHRLGPWALDTAVAIDSLTIGSADLLTYPMGLSNAAKSVKKYSRELNPVHLTTDNYTFTYNYPGTLDDAQPVESSLGHYDEVADDTVVTHFWYERKSLDWYVPYAPKHKHTVVTKTQTRYLDGSKPDTVLVETTYPSTIANYQGPYLILPTEEKVSVNNKVKSRTTFAYDTSHAYRRFGGDSLLTAYFGPVVTKLTEWTKRPTVFTGDVLNILVTEKEFLHFPEFDTTLTIIDSVWDKTTMWERFNELQDSDPTFDLEWEEARWDPRIFELFSADTVGVLGFRAAPIYDLPSKTTVKLPSGQVLGGSIYDYCIQGDCAFEGRTPQLSEQMQMRGALLFDTAVGRGGKKVLETSYGYTFASPGRPTMLRNALGAKSHHYWAYGGVGAMDVASFTNGARGLLKYNDDDTGSVNLRNSTMFAYWYGLPVGEAGEVRRFNSSAALVNDTLTTLYERTFFGQVSGSVEPNGWFSRFAYDKNGRLETAWLPFDHQSPDSAYYWNVVGVEDEAGYGFASYDVHYDTIDCPNSLKLGPVENIVWSYLHVGKPAEVSPACPECQNGTEKEQAEGAAQETCNPEIPYSHRTNAKGTVRLQLPRDIYGYTVVDSVWATFHVSSVVGQCVTVTVEAEHDPGTTLKTFVFNCPLGTGGYGADTIGGETFSIDLTGLWDTILARRGIGLVLKTQTTDGYVAFGEGMVGEDMRPRLFIDGEFVMAHPLSDYTLRYEHDDVNLTTDVWAKVDDSAHTANRISNLAMLGESRRTRARHNFGADYRVLFSESFIGDPASWLRVDTTRAIHDGEGAVRKAIDAERDTLATLYDARNRPTRVINQDGTYSTVEYFDCGYTGTDIGGGTFLTVPCYDIPVSDQDFYGYVSGTTATDERGVKFTRYYDAFDRLRREVADSGGLHRVTRYDYDALGRLTRVVNPAKDTIRYWYDDFGRVRYVRQPDQGTISYAYDKLGNLRFAQTEEQARMWRMTFYEYDDLNRLRLVGETMFDTAAGGGHPPYSVGPEFHSGRYDGVTGEKTQSEAALLANPVDDTVNLGRVTDLADPNVLHDEGASGILTANKTLVLDPATYGKSVPQFWNLTGWNDRFDKTFTTCSPLTTAVPGAQTPYMYHPAPFRDTVNEYSTLSNFEHLAKHPENGRLCVNYDRLPDALGPVWKHFPAQNRWDSLMPGYSVRNLKGREAAVAYREHAGQPYHFAVMSYDERGRVEAVARYTENVGFEVVYYTYNSMNQVTSVRLIDPFRQHATWYGYDYNGRVDSVWTTLTSGGSWGTYGLNVGSSAQRPGFMASRPTNADISYAYTRTGRVDTMFYPAIGVDVDYHYDRRKRLDTMRSANSSGRFFEQFLTYDVASRITRQRSVRNAADTLKQDYTYDNLSQLLSWNWLSPSSASQQTYTYDSVGNRVRLDEGFGLPAPPYEILTTGRTTASATDGPNQTVEIQKYLNPTTPNGKETNAYDPDGALALTETYNQTNGLTLREKRRWSSWRGLPFRYRREQPQPMPPPQPWDTLRFEWEYRYNAMGEREQKREILHPGGATSSNPYTWTYYGLSGTNAQLSVWKGVETNAAVCGSPGLGSSWVWLAPTEYLTYGGGSASIITKPSGAGGDKEFRISDHLGSNRVTLSASGTLLKQTDYEPFGDVLNGTSDRKGFIDREHDAESDEGNFGMRQYDDKAGRFTSIDPLWEKYYSLNPYQYAANNPVSYSDPNGDSILLEGLSDEAKRHIHYIGQTTYGETVMTHFNVNNPEVDVSFVYTDLSDVVLPGEGGRGPTARVKIEEGEIVDGEPYVTKLLVELDPKAFEALSEERKIETLGEELWHTYQYSTDPMGWKEKQDEHYNSGGLYHDSPAEKAAKSIARVIMDDVVGMRVRGILTEPTE